MAAAVDRGRVLRCGTHWSSDGTDEWSVALVLVSEMLRQVKSTVVDLPSGGLINLGAHVADTVGSG